MSLDYAQHVTALLGPTNERRAISMAVVGDAWPLNTAPRGAVAFGCYMASDRTIYLRSEPSTPIDYAVALHELGHAMYNDTRTHWTTLDQIMTQECRAWQWALSNARYWDSDMTRLMVEGLATYAQVNGQSVSGVIVAWMDQLVQNAKRFGG